MITADNITNEQIDALWREGCGPGPHPDADPDLMHLATAARNAYGEYTPQQQRDARQRCADILNTRGKS